MRCAIFQINTNLLIIERNINIFTQETLYRKKIGGLHREHFSKHPYFTPFSLFLTVSEVCNISNKYWLPNKSATKIFVYTIVLQNTLHCSFIPTKKLCCRSQKVSERSTFYHIFTWFQRGWGVQYFK